MAIVDGSLQLGYKNTAWFTANASLVLLVGQIVYLEQTGTYKLGDGTTQLSALTFLGGGGTVDVNTIGTAINGSTSATPNDTDLVMSVDTSVAKKNTWTQIKAFLKTYFDTVYATITDLTGYVKKGTLTTNYIQKATSSDTIGDSIIKENATGIDIGVTTLAGATAKLHLESDGTNPAFKTQSSIGVENFIIKEDGKINTPLLTPSQIVETDASKNLVSVAKGTAYNKDFGTGTANIAEIGSTLGNTKPVITSSSGKLQTSDWVDITSSCTILGWISFVVNKIKSIDMGNYYIVNGQVTGTSNSSTTQVVLPFTNNGVHLDDCRFAINNGTNIFARCFVGAGSNTVDFRATVSGGSFSSAGTKAIYFTIVVEK